MESKIIEYGIILLHKFKAEQTELISRVLFTFLLTNFKNVWSDRTFTFSQYIFIPPSQLRSHEFRKYSSNHILKVNEGVHLTLPPDTFSVQVKSGACYITDQWVASSE